MGMRFIIFFQKRSAACPVCIRFAVIILCGIPVFIPGYPDIEIRCYYNTVVRKTKIRAF